MGSDLDVLQSGGRSSRTHLVKLQGQWASCLPFPDSLFLGDTCGTIAKATCRRESLFILHFPEWLESIVGQWGMRAGSRHNYGIRKLKAHVLTRMHNVYRKQQVGKTTTTHGSPQRHTYPSCLYLTQKLWTQCPLRLGDVSHSKMPTEEEFGREK